MIPSACSTPMPGCGESATSKAAISSTRTIPTHSRRTSTRPNFTSDVTSQLTAVTVGTIPGATPGIVFVVLPPSECFRHLGL